MITTESLKKAAEELNSNINIKYDEIEGESYWDIRVPTFYNSEMYFTIATIYKYEEDDGAWYELNVHLLTYDPTIELYELCNGDPDEMDIVWVLSKIIQAIYDQLNNEYYFYKDILWGNTRII